MQRRWSLIVLAALALLTPVATLAARPVFENFTNSNIVVKAMAVQGPFLWAGTDGGVVRWSVLGGTMEKFTTARGLVNNQVSSIVLDGSGAVWVGTFGGVSRYANGLWTSFDASSGLVNPRVEALFISSSGEVWIGTRGGVSVFDGRSFRNFTTADGLLDNWVKDITEVAGSLFFATDRGISVFDGDSWGKYDRSDGLPSDSISCLAGVEDGLWAGTKGEGVCFFDGIAWRTYTRDDGISGSLIYDLFVSGAGDVWAVTEQGVSCFSQGRWASFSSEDGLPEDRLLSIAVDDGGDVFLGTARSGVWCWVGGTVLSLTSPQGVLDNQVRSVAEGLDGAIWFGCETGVSVLKGDVWDSWSEAAGRAMGRVNAVLTDGSGALWVGTDGSGLFRFDGQHWDVFDETGGLCDDRVFSLATLNGFILAGTADGLSVFDGARFWSVTADDGLPFQSVEVVAVGYDGRVYLGNHSESGGLAVIYAGSIRHLTAADGLPSDSIYAVNAERSGVVWVGTDAGAVVWDERGMRTYGRGDGLAGFVVKAIEYGQAGKVWFGATGGISRFDGQSFESFTQSDGLADNRVSGLVVDAKGAVWVATLGGATKVSFPESEHPRVVISADKRMYRPGDEAVCLLRVSNPGASVRVDLYAGLLDSEGRIWTIGPNGNWQSGVAAWAADFPLPAGASIAADPLFVIKLPSYFPAVFEEGQYWFAAGLTWPGSAELVGEISLFGFEFRY